jgi:plasmid stabilization system protein ParE
MAMTLRLSPQAEADLERIVERTHLSKNAAVEEAIRQMAARMAQSDRAREHVARINARDADLLARLADA